MRFSIIFGHRVNLWEDISGVILILENTLKKKKKKNAVSESHLFRTHLDSFAWRMPHTQKNLPSGPLSKLTPRAEGPMLLFRHSVVSNSLGPHGL